MGTIARDRLVALFEERLAAERLSVRLYESVQLKLSAGERAWLPEVVPALDDCRREEVEHVAWLEARLRELGVEPAPAASDAGLLALEKRGLFRLILAPEEGLARTLHALLGAELLDHAAWHSLGELAGDAGDEALRLELNRRAWEEGVHVELARELVDRIEREARAPRAA
jgi:hypothetical protein